MDDEIVFEVILPAITSAPDMNLGCNISLTDIGQCPIPDGSTTGTALKLIMQLFGKAR